MGSSIYHTIFGFCHWDIPAAIVLAIVIVIFIIRHRKLKKKEKALENQLLEMSSNGKKKTVDAIE